jgi:hypothetical protein
MLETIIEAAAILFALLGGFITNYLLMRNETITKRLGLDYHCLRSILHLFNHEKMFKNPDVSKKILGPILDYLAYVCQLWYIPAVQGQHLRKNVLKALPGKNLKEHFLDTAKHLDESRGQVRVLPKYLFPFVVCILFLLAGITLCGILIKLIHEPTLILFIFYTALLIFYALFFALIYMLYQTDIYFIPKIMTLLKWLFIRCLIFASTNREWNTKDYKETVSEYLKSAKSAYDDYTKLEYITNSTRQKSLEYAEKVAKQFLDKRKNINKDWEEEVEWTVPKAATKVLTKRYEYRLLGNIALNIIFIVVLIILISVLFCFDFSCFRYSWILVILIVGVIYFLWQIVREKKTPSFLDLENLYRCWDVIISTEQEYGKMTDKKCEKVIERKIEECIKNWYLFSWEEIPGNDSDRLTHYLMSNYDVDWIKTAKIAKTNNGNTINITAGKNFLLLNLNNENTELNLIIDNVKTDKFIVKTENGKLNIYKNCIWRKGGN